jgi:hypothetical protein
MRNHLIVAALLIIEEMVIGSGFGQTSFLVGAPLLIIYLADRPRNGRRLVLAGIYTLAGVASFAVILLNWRVAEARSKPVIAACKEFHTKYQSYPAELGDLVPEFLPAVPHAGYTLISRRFNYFPSRPAIGFAVMFHGIASYDLQKNKWQTNE